MSVDTFLVVLVGASIVAAVLIIRVSKKRGGKSTPWLDETRGMGMNDEADIDD